MCFAPKASTLNLRFAPNQLLRSWHNDHLHGFENMDGTLFAAQLTEIYDGSEKKIN